MVIRQVMFVLANVLAAVGLDIREKAVAALAALGYNTLCCDFLKLDLDTVGTFDVVSMADVVEHLPYPREGLLKANSITNEGGLLFISMPNRDCLTWKVLDLANANPFWFELEHYHNFDRQGLYNLLRECGYEPVGYSCSARYRSCMEIIARKESDVVAEVTE